MISLFLLHFSGFICIFLHAHPFGASIDYLYSYLSRLHPNIVLSDIDGLLHGYPNCFVQELSGVGASLERRWKFVAFEHALKKSWIFVTFQFEVGLFIFKDCSPRIWQRKNEQALCSPCRWHFNVSRRNEILQDLRDLVKAFPLDVILSWEDDQHLGELWKCYLNVQAKLWTVLWPVLPNVIKECIGVSVARCKSGMYNHV